MKPRKRSKPRAVWVGFDVDNNAIWGPHTKLLATRWAKRCQAIGRAVSIEKYVREVKRRGNAVNEVKNWDKKKRDTLSAIYEARQKAQRNDN